MDNLRFIEAQLRKRDSQSMLTVMGMLLVGFVLSLLAPLLLTFLAWESLSLWRRPVGWWWIFVPVTVICCLSLYRLEWKAQGGSFQGPKEDRGPAPEPATPAATYGHLGMLGNVLAHERTPVSGFSEIFLLGPRLVISCWRRILLERMTSGADRKRVAEVLELLTRLPSGAATDKLLAEGETPEQLSRVLIYLLSFDWIGVARDGSKVWVLTAARNELRAPAPAA